MFQNDFEKKQATTIVQNSLKCQIGDLQKSDPENVKSTNPKPTSLKLWKKDDQKKYQSNQYNTTVKVNTYYHQSNCEDTENQKLKSQPKSMTSLTTIMKRTSTLAHMSKLSSPKLVNRYVFPESKT